MLKCVKCGFDNELGRIFCHQCGSKLDINQIKPPSRGGATIHRKGEASLGRVVWRVVQIALVGLIIWALVLVAQVPTARPLSTSADDAAAVTKKRLTLERQVDTKKPASIVLSEAELSAFFGTLGVENSDSKGISFQSTKLEVRIDNGALCLYVFGNFKFGAYRRPAGFTYTVVPAIENGRCEFKPVSASIGLLPIHPFILQNTDLVQSYYAQLFRNLGEERKLLDRLTSIEVQHERVVLHYEPSGAAK